MGGSLFINDDKRELPERGPIQIPLPPSKEQYHFRLVRKGFQEKRFARVSQEDDQTFKASDCEPLVPDPAEAWEQDFDAAKKMAADGHKNLLILFDASDSKQNGFASSRFREAVAKRSEFHKRIDNEYVCVYIDNPQDAKAQDKVKDAVRNRELTQKFRIAVFPTVVAVDPRGTPHPYGIMEGYSNNGINGVNAFLELLDKWRADHASLFELLARADSMPAENADAEQVEKFLDFLEMTKLDRFYRGTMKGLADRLPNGEGRPVPKEKLDEWALHFEQASGNADALKKLVSKFDEWKKTRVFKDHDLAARFHFFVARLLAQLDLRQEAAQKCKEGLEFHPRDPGVRSLLEFLRPVRRRQSGRRVPRRLRDRLLRGDGQLRVDQPPRD